MFLRRQSRSYFIGKNRQVDICTIHIDIFHHLMRGMVEEKDMDIKYISSEEKPEYIMTNNCSEADHTKHGKKITEGEIQDIMDTGRENVSNNGFMDGVKDFDSTE